MILNKYLRAGKTTQYESACFLGAGRVGGRAGSDSRRLLFVLSCQEKSP